ncbi:CFEM domain-containing protein [Diaporthe eres]|nr:CFEM domain-containing protein [Diaporthe eres]
MWLTLRAASLGCGVPVTDSSGSLKLLHALLFVAHSIFFFLRMTTRALRLVPWGLDDTTIVIAWVLAILFFASGIVEADLGVGKPYWALEFWQIDESFIVFFAFEAVYNLCLGMIKISICFFYMRIFQSPGFQRVMLGTQIFNVLTGLSFFLVGWAQCRPLSLFWRGWSGEYEGTCFDINAFAYAHAAVNMAIDVWMLILPGTQVWRLNMNFKRKLAVTLMFACGFLLTAISITRFTYIIGFFGNWAKSTDAQGLYNAGIWTAVELTAGLIVACLPASRIIVTKYVIKVLDSTGLSKSSRKSQLPSSPENSNRPSQRGPGRASGMLTSKFWLPVNSIVGSTATIANDTQLESTRHVHDADGESNMELVSVRSHAVNDTEAAADLSRRPSQLGEKRQTSENV